MNKLILLVVLATYATFAFGAKDKNKLTRKQKKQIVQMDQLQWNFTQVQMYQENEKLLARLEKRLSKGQIIGIELVTAAPTDIRFESKWGHTMMRFVDNVRSSNNDISLGFIADLESPKTNYVKGLIGGYPVYPILKTMSGFTEQYIKGEDRALDRYVIPTTPEMVKDMVAKLRLIVDELNQKNYASLEEEAARLKSKLEKKQKKKKYKDRTIHEITEGGFVIGYTFENGIEEESEVYAVEMETEKSKLLKGYTFLKNNCAGALVKFFKETSFQFIRGLKWKGRVPIKLNDFLDHYYLSSFNKVSVPAIVDFKKKLEELTGKTYEELNEFEAWAEIDFDQLLGALNTRELMLLMDQENLGILPQQQDIALDRLMMIEDKPNYDELYQISTLPQVMYMACQNTQCVNEQLEAGNKIINKVKLLKKLSTKKRVKKKDLDKPFLGELIHYNNLLREVLTR